MKGVGVFSVLIWVFIVHTEGLGMCFAASVFFQLVCEKLLCFQFCVVNFFFACGFFFTTLCNQLLSKFRGIRNLIGITSQSLETLFSCDCSFQQLWVC